MFPDADEARRLTDQLGESVVFYKLGLELFMSGGYFELLDWMVGRGKKIFVDLKFFDVPATVASAVRNLQNRGVTFTTVHGNQSIMEAAAAAKGDVKVLAVTVLTSLDRGDLDDLGFKPATSSNWCCRGLAAHSRLAATAWCPRASRQSCCAPASTTG
jgi:orotidine-5'-phosphate decarboxylase